MTETEFVNHIYAEMIEYNAYYIQSLQNLKPENIKDPDWKNIKNLFDRLDAKQRLQLELFMKIISANTIAGIFAKLDNISAFANQSGWFELYSDGKKISDNLLDLFWEKIETDNT